MALRMARPWKHPKTGVYWLRKRVPDELRHLVGKREEKLSLRTKDPEEAKRLHAIALVELDARWQNLRKPARTISEFEAFQMVRVFEENVFNHHAANPSQQDRWDPEIGKIAFEQSLSSYDGLDGVFDLNAKGDFSGASLRLDPVRLKRREYEASCRAMADERLHELGWTVDGESKERLARAIAHALQRSALRLQKMARGDWSETAPEKPSAAASPALPEVSRGEIEFSTLLNGWKREKSPSDKTYYMWSRVVTQLTEFLEHTDAARVTSADLLRWKTSLMDTELSPKTIRDSKLAPVRAILQWGVDNGLLTDNPCSRVTISVKDNLKESRRGFNDNEAKLIIDAALGASGHTKWITLLCAYSGARVAEICQLRKEDVRETDGVWCFEISAEAGSVKNANSQRTVPIHSAVKRAGFLDFVKKAKSGPLFPELKPDRFGNRGGTGTKQLSRWVRSLGITDKRLGPNHSWRHRFKTNGRRYGLAGDLINAMTGHGRKTVADLYGEYPIPALARELEKIPEI